MKAQRGSRGILYSFFNLGLIWGGWSRHAPAALSPEKDPLPIVQAAGWAPGPVWTAAENRASTEIRSPDRPARSELLFRLSYRGPQLLAVDTYYLAGSVPYCVFHVKLIMKGGQYGRSLA
jgi:hypothetical protein